MVKWKWEERHRSGSGWVRQVVDKAEAEKVINRMKEIHCAGCRKATKDAGFPIGPCSPSCEWNPVESV